MRHDFVERVIKKCLLCLRTNPYTWKSCLHRKKSDLSPRIKYARGINKFPMYFMISTHIDTHVTGISTLFFIHTRIHHYSVQFTIRNIFIFIECVYAKKTRRLYFSRWVWLFWMCVFLRLCVYLQESVMVSLTISLYAFWCKHLPRPSMSKKRRSNNDKRAVVLALRSPMKRASNWYRHLPSEEANPT